MVQSVPLFTVPFRNISIQMDLHSAFPFRSIFDLPIHKRAHLASDFRDFLSTDCNSNWILHQRICLKLYCWVKLNFRQIIMVSRVIALKALSLKTTHFWIKAFLRPMVDQKPLWLFVSHNKSPWINYLKLNFFHQQESQLDFLHLLHMLATSNGQDVSIFE